MFSDEGTQPELEQPSSSDPFSTPLLAVTDDNSPGVPYPAVSHSRLRRSAPILLPKWVYIKDMNGRYLSVRGTGLNNLTIRSGEPDLSCAFEVTAADWLGDWFRFRGSNGHNIMRWNTTTNLMWYSCESTPNYSTFEVITTTGNYVYMRDNVVPTGFKSSELTGFGSPIASTIINNSNRFEILQAAVRNEIIDVRYNVPNGSISEEPPLIALSTSVRNDSNGDVNQTLTYTYERWSVGTWNNAEGTEIGASATFTAGTPFVSAEFGISVSSSRSQEWGGEEGQRQIITSSTMVTVPPRRRARAMVTVRNARLDVGFTYTQRILWSNGQREEKARTGIYNNVDSWHVDVVLDNWEDV